MGVLTPGPDDDWLKSAKPRCIVRFFASGPTARQSSRLNKTENPKVISAVSRCGGWQTALSSPSSFCPGGAWQRM
jgi:hypothetical protein